MRVPWAGEVGLEPPPCLEPGDMGGKGEGRVLCLDQKLHFDALPSPSRLRPETQS